MKWTKEIPNLITMSNMACGLLGIGFVISGQEWMGFVMMIAGAALDFFDGFAARKLGVAGEMGKQLDSMADVVTFGVLPGLIWKAMMEYQGYCPADRFCINGYTWLLIPLAAGYRLAKFNIDQRQTTGFYGIPTPITGLVLGSFAWMSYNLGHPGDLWFIDNPVIDIRSILNHFWVWLYMPLLTAFMMVSDVPMLAMKFGVNDPLRKFKLLLVALAVLCVVWICGRGGFLLFVHICFAFGELCNQIKLKMKKIGIIMGSDSDLPVMKEAGAILDSMGVAYEITVVSAHRTPVRLMEYASSAAERGLEVIIAGAGGAAHLPGMVASFTHLPVIGVPVQTKTMSGMDSLYSIVQMPPGVPVATVAINGAKNAGILAAQILGVADKSLAQRVADYKELMRVEVMGKAEKLEREGWKKYLGE